MSQPEFAFSFKAFNAEEFFARRLHDHRRAIHAGVTDAATRQERIRQAILTGGLDCTIIGRDGKGKPETYGQAFERHFGTPLVPKLKGK